MQLEDWVREGEQLMNRHKTPLFTLGGWWAERPWGPIVSENIKLKALLCDWAHKGYSPTREKETLEALK